MAVKKVALFLGQSNCAGAGQPLYLAANHAHLIALSSSHLIWNQRLPPASETIAPGVNTNTTLYGMQSVLHGPEVNFAYQYNQATGDPIYVFKHAVIGTLGNTRVGTPGLPIWNKAAGEVYPVMLAQLAAFEAAITPNEGDSIEYVGVFWIHGESDVGALNALNYLRNLKQLVADLRTDLATPLLPIHICRLHDDYAGQQVPANAIRAAQWQAVTDLADANVTLIDTDAFDVGPDNVHFDDAGIQLFGAGCYTQTTLDNPGVGSAVLDANTEWLTDIGFAAAAANPYRSRS